MTDEITRLEPVFAVIYGDREPHTCREGDSTTLPMDIFGSSFFMLSKYEEVVTPDRDEHDRFPTWASVAYQQNFLEWPIVDEYLEVMWATMRIVWPRLERRRREATIRVTYDVDRPARYRFGSFRRFVRSLGGDILKRGQFGSLVRGPRTRYGMRNRLHPADPYNTFDWLMD